METEYIHGGAFQVARKLFESDLWENKPSTWKVIWVYILGNVNHKQNGLFERGEGFFNFSKDLRKVGNDITEDMVKKFCSYAKKNQMISTERSTRGMRIKVLNYNKYQTMGTYVRTSLGTSLARDKHEPSTPINKNDKKEKKNTFVLPEQEIRVESDDERPAKQSRPVPTTPDEVVDFWNSLPNWKATGKHGTPSNPTVQKELLRASPKTRDIIAAVVRKRTKYSQEDFERAIRAYATEIANRTKDAKGFYQHRFTLYEFLVNKEVFERYANR